MIDKLVEYQVKGSELIPGKPALFYGWYGNDDELFSMDLAQGGEFNGGDIFMFIFGGKKDNQSCFNRNYL